MNVNMIQLNSKKVDTGNLEKISLKVNGESNAVDFQNVLASLLGMSVGFENLTEDNQLPIEQPLNVDSDNLKMLLTNENLAKVNLTIGNNNLEMILGSEQLYPNDTKMELPKTEVLEKLITDIQTDLNVKEIIASTEQKDIEFTPQSYNNMLKIKFKGDVIETKEVVKEINVQAQDVEKAAKPDVLKKVVGLEKAVENNDKRKSVSFKIEDGKLVKTENKETGLEKAVESSNKRKPEDLEIEDDKMIKAESSLVSKAEGNKASISNQAKAIENNQEVREAMVESIKEAQTNGISKVKIMLKPAELGNVEIELKMENGKIKGEIKVLNAEIKNQIEQLILPIKETLKEQNIILKDFQVTVSSQFSEGEFSNNQNMNSHQNKYEPKFVDYHYNETIQEDYEVQNDEKGLNLFA